MKKLFTLLCLCTLFFFSNAQCPLTNGGFENGLAGWNVTGDVQISTDSRTGSSAAEICSAQTGINQIFPTQPGKVFDVRFWYNTASNHELSVFQIRSLDANFTPLEIPGSNGIIYATEGGLVFQTNGVYTSSIEFTINTPPNAAWFQVSIWNQQGGCISIDDFEVCESGTPPPPPPPATCNISADVSLGACRDNDTPSDPSDDVYDITLNVTNPAGITGYQLSIPQIFNLQYGTPFTFVNSINDGPITLVITDNDDATCTTTISAGQPPAPCSNNGGGGGNGADLVLTAVDVPQNVDAFANTTVQFALSNTGTATSSNIEVAFDIDANATLQGGNEFDASQGTLANFWLRTPTWQVGSLAPGQSATIDLNIFTLSGNVIPIYGQVSNASGADADSTPGNGTPPTPNEDDEAIANINGGGNPPPPPPGGVANLQIGSFTIPPMVTQGQNLVSGFNFRNVGTAAVNQSFDITGYISTDRNISNNDFVVGNIRFTDTPIEVGENNVLDMNISIPSNIPAGDYFFIMIVDANDEITESNEFDNINLTLGGFEVLDASSAQPDLTITSLVLNDLTVRSGEVLDYTFDIANIGNANIPQNFNVRAYLSTDGDISNDDVQDGIVPTGNFDAGLLVQNVPGASTINLPDGQYFLILRVDADNQVNESDETNNDLQANIQFTVDNTPGGNGSICDSQVGTDLPTFNSFNCIEEIPNTDLFRLIYNTQAGEVVKTIDSNLSELSSSTNPSPELPQLVLDDNILSRVFPDGTVSYTRIVPQAFLDRFQFKPQFFEYLSSFVAFGVADDPAVLKAFLLDLNLNVIREKEVPVVGDPTRNYINSFQVVSGAGVGANFAFISGSNITFGSSATLRLWDSNLNELDNLPLFSGAWQGGANMKANACRKWTVTDGVGLGFCKSGGCYRSESREVDFQNNSIQQNSYYGVEHFTTLGVGSETYDWSAATSDGGIVTANRNQALNGNSNSVPNDAQVTFTKTDANGNQLWMRDYLITDWEKVFRIYESGGEIYILKNVDGNLLISELECYGLPTNLPDLEITDVNAPATVAPGGTFLFNFNLSNNGTIASGTSNAALYFSRDDRLGFDNQIGNVFLPFASVPAGSVINAGTSAAIPYSTPGTYYLLIVADANSEVAESDENNNLIAIPFEVTDASGGGGVDLEISTNLGNPSPAQWSVFSATVAVSNNGSETATGVQVEYQPTTNAVYQGGSEGTVSQGTFRHWANVWDVGTLAPGEIATLTVNLFRVGGNNFVMYTQVAAQNEADADSTPNNGVCCSAREDDEGTIVVGPAANGVNNRNNIVQNIGNQPFAIVNTMPNPFTEQFKLQVFSNENQESELTVMNAMGQSIFQTTINLTEGMNTISVDLDSDASGILMVKMTPFHPYLRKIRVMRLRE